jgi:hypothetical protein
MRVYEAIKRALQFLGADAAFGSAGVNILTTFFAWGVSHA